jgi:hypothetical protein
MWKTTYYSAIVLVYFSRIHFTFNWFISIDIPMTFQKSIWTLHESVKQPIMFILSDDAVGNWFQESLANFHYNCV